MPESGDHDERIGRLTQPRARRATSRFPAHPIAGLAGTSFKHQHLPAILAEGKQDGFFEVHAENYMGAGGPPHEALARIRRDYPVSLHGVCMSIGGPQPLDKTHLGRFKALVDRYEPALVSEHLAWSTHDTTYFNDLLPLPYTQATLARVADHIDEVQEAIGRPILLENPSTYLIFPESTMSETDFIRELVRRSGCGLLLDVNNVFVSATNHGFSALDYLADFPLEHVGEIHLAGHAEQADDEGDLLLIDSHDGPVADAVWKLFDIVIGRCGPIPTLVEWDSAIPDWPVLKAEAAAAQAILDRHAHSFMLGQSPCLIVASRILAAVCPTRRVFAPPLLDPDRATPACGRRAERQGRDEALQRLSQQRHRQSDRRAGGGVSGDACASPARTSFARWRASMCAPRRRPRRFSSNTAATFPISSSATNTRSRCRGWRTWRGSSGHGSTPIMPPMPNRWRRRPWLRSLRSAWPTPF